MYDHNTVMTVFEGGVYGKVVRDAGTHWELYRKRPVKAGVRNSMFFDKYTFRPSSSVK